MGTGYTRNDTGNNITSGATARASDIDGEYDAIEAAFNETTGHTHDGTSDEGGPITLVGPSQEVTVDADAIFPSTDGVTESGKAALRWQDVHADNMTPLQITMPDGHVHAIGFTGYDSDVYDSDLDSLAGSTRGVTNTSTGASATNHWGTPTAGDWVRTEVYDANTSRQDGFSVGGYTAFRVKTSGSWSSWIPKATANNALMVSSSDLAASDVTERVAYAVITDASATMTVPVEAGCTVTRSGTGVYVCTFDNARATSNYMVYVTNRDASTIGIHSLFSVGTSSFEMRWYTTAGALQDMDAFNFFVEEVK